MSHTNVQENINKFYILQILQSLKNPEDFYFYTRYGRVGLVGYPMTTGPMKVD